MEITRLPLERVGEWLATPYKMPRLQDHRSLLALGLCFESHPRTEIGQENQLVSLKEEGRLPRPRPPHDYEIIVNIDAGAWRIGQLCHQPGVPGFAEESDRSPAEGDAERAGRPTATSLGGALRSPAPGSHPVRGAPQALSPAPGLPMEASCAPGGAGGRGVG